MANVFLTPGKLIMGDCALTQAGKCISGLGTKALVVSDSMMSKIGNLKKVTDVLVENGIQYSTYDKVNTEPTDTIVNNGAEQFIRDNCDFLISIGGGSPLDTMKAIAVIATTGGTPADYVNKEINSRKPKMVAIPTTAGTGSEATQFTIITNTKSNVKMLLKGAVLLPDIAVIDPQFTMTCPPKVTAATGIDALCHAIESYSSRKSQPMSDTFSLSAAKRIFTYLKRSYESPDDVKAHIEMAIAATEAGIAFNNSSVTIIHGMSRPIGALFHVPHGISNAMLMSTCLRFVKDGAVEKFADIARMCAMADAKASDDRAADILLDNIDKLLAELRIPKISEYGLDRKIFDESIGKMAQDAFDSGSPSNTRKHITVGDMELLYHNIW